MITIESFGPGGKNAGVQQASRVVLKDGAGNPLVAAVVYDTDVYLVSTCNDADFDTILQTLGMKASRVVKQIDLSSG